MKRVPVPLRASAAIAIALAALAAPAAQTPSPGAGLDLSPKALVAAATQYVSDYATKLAFVLADESYFQETFASREHRTGSRRMKGEIFLTFLPADREWIAVHDVVEVDGEPVKDREALQALLTQGALTSIAQKVADRNARYNIGTIGRNFNEPTLALLVLEPSRVKNFNFTRQAVEQVGSATVVTLAFTEKDRPTLVRSQSGQPVFSKGEIAIEAGTGRVRRTRIAFKYGDIQAELTTSYRPDPKIDLWVPTTFSEQYEGLRNGLKEIIVCSASYANYRRFEVLGRIKR
jgi:hypothetical protein